MKTTSRRPMSKAPQRRNCGTRMRTAPTISPMPSAIAPGSASAPGNRNSTRACDQVYGSVSFQAPDTKNRIARSTAQTPPMTFFKAGKSKLAIPTPKWAGVAVVSDIDPSFYRIPRGPELLGDFDRPGDILLAVGRRNESRLELRGRQVDSPVQHPMEKLAETARIGALGRFPVRYRLLNKEKGEHGPHAVHHNARRDLGRKLRGAALDDLVDLRMRFQVAQHSDPRAHRHRISGQRAGLINGTGRRHLAHDVGAPSVGCQRHSASDDLAEG